MLTLAIGDLHVPTRALEIPDKFRKLLCPQPNQVPTNSKIGHVLCLGNVSGSPESLGLLHGISPMFHAVRGEFDDVGLLTQHLRHLDGKDHAIGTYGVMTMGGLRIGYTNGYNLIPRGDPMALLVFAREIDVDVLVWGGTHRREAYTLDGKFFINPGSATGAYTFDWPANYDDDEEEDESKAVDEDNENNKADDKNADGNLEGDNKYKEKENDANDKGDSSKDEKGDTEENAAHLTKPDPSDTTNSADQDQDQNQAQNPSNQGQSNDKTHINNTQNTAMPASQGLFGHESLEDADDAATMEIDESILDKVDELTSCTPSFCLLDTQGTTCTLFIYTLVQGEVKVDKVTYHKED